MTRWWYEKRGDDDMILLKTVGNPTLPRESSAHRSQVTKAVSCLKGGSSSTHFHHMPYCPNHRRWQIDNLSFLWIPYLYPTHLWSPVQQVWPVWGEEPLELTNQWSPTKAANVSMKSCFSNNFVMVVLVVLQISWSNIYLSVLVVLIL